MWINLKSLRSVREIFCWVKLLLLSSLSAPRGVWSSRLGPQIQVPGPTDTCTGTRAHWYMHRYFAHRYRFQGPRYRYWGPRIQGLVPTDSTRLEHNYSVFWTELRSIVDTRSHRFSVLWYQCPLIPVPSAQFSLLITEVTRNQRYSVFLSIKWILGSTDTGTLTTVYRYYDTQIRQTGMALGYADTLAGLTYIWPFLQVPETTDTEYN